MRSFEWLIILSFVPTLLLLFIPPLRRRGWLLVAVSLPTLATVLHLAVEGWRTQMVPLYILAALVLASRLPVLLGRDGAVWPGRGVLASSVTALILILGGVLAGWLLPVITLPEPTGPYQVGIADRELVDVARGRRLMVSVWYPASQRGAPAPLTHHPDQVMTARANLAGLPAPLFQHRGILLLPQCARRPALRAQRLDLVPHHTLRRAGRSRVRRSRCLGESGAGGSRCRDKGLHRFGIRAVRRSENLAGIARLGRRCARTFCNQATGRTAHGRQFLLQQMDSRHQTQVNIEGLRGLLGGADARCQPPFFAGAGGVSHMPASRRMRLMVLG